MNDGQWSEDQYLLFVNNDQGHDHFHHGTCDLAVVRKARATSDQWFSKGPGTWGNNPWFLMSNATIPFLNTILKVKISFLAPFTSKSADFYEVIRPKGAEKQAVSLRNGLEK